jgi:hypothetical protein
VYLAAIQLAGARSSRNDVWKDLVQDLVSKRKKSKWFTKVTKELAERGLERKVLLEGDSVVASRKEIGVQFAQFCFHKHLNKNTNTSADDFRKVKPFGTYPFLLNTPPVRSRFLLSFLLCNWRWIDKGKCRNYPRSCDDCQTENTAWHLLYDCPRFERIRTAFEDCTGYEFSFEVLPLHSRVVTLAAVEVGERIFECVARDCAN